MKSLLVLPTGRRARWVVVVLWFLAMLVIFGTNVPGKYSDAESNERTAYLPGDAEATRALERATELTGSEEAPIVLVYRREGGLTPADQQRIRSDLATLNAEVEGTSEPFRFAERSSDGTAVIVTSSITATGGEEGMFDPVDQARDLVSGTFDGLEVALTGPAGYGADSTKVFETIDTQLFLAAFALVFVLLILIYRSPFLLWLPLIAVGLAETAGRAVGLGLTEIGVTVNGQSAAIQSVLVLGAGTDYALLLIARYREELRHRASRTESMQVALRGAGPAIIASGSTVIAALLCLSLAELNATASMGPIGAAGILMAMLAMLTLLPAMLVIAPRSIFWPKIPREGTGGIDAEHGPWRRLGDGIARRPRTVWIAAGGVLLVMCLGLLNYDTGLTSSNSFRDQVESVEGEDLLAQSFPGGMIAPTEIIVPEPSQTGAVIAAVTGVEGVAEVFPVLEEPDGVLLNAVLEPEPYSTEAFDLIPPIRDAAHGAGDEILVGGASAVEYDNRQASDRDNKVIVPVVLAVVFLILILLLRALATPLLLMGTVILSFFAALGVGFVAFDVIFGFPGVEPSIPLYAFVFLVALGIDYNIFLMARVREETIRHGTREGMLRGLAVTGGVITSAGIVLAGTFSVLAVLPLVFMAQIGMVVAFGVLLDTFLVRSVLVPALTLDIGSRVWWPSALMRKGEKTGPEQGEG